MIKKLIKSKTKSTIGAAIVVGLASLVSRFIGLVRDKIFAHQFGASNILDAYYAAFRVPDLVYNLLVVGALSAGFIPVFKQILEEKNKQEAWKVTNGILNIIGISLVVVCSLLFIFTPQLMQLVVPGFSGEKLDLTITMTRVMFLSPVLLGLSSIASGVLQACNSFIVYSLTPIVYNIGIIAGALFFVPIMGEIGLAWGVILGACFHLLIQIPTLLHLGFNYQPILPWNNKYIKKIGRMMVPRTLGLAANQMNFLVMTSLASTLTAGSLTIFNFAKNIQYFPVGIIGYSFALAAFPALSEMIANDNKLEMKQHLIDTARKVLFFVVPITILFLLLRAQIVRVVFGSGEFGWDATIKTADALAYFSMSLFAQSLIPLLIRGFFAVKDTWSPFIIAMISMVVNVGFALFLKEFYGVAGLAMAFSISMVVQFALLWVLLRIKMDGLNEIEIVPLAGKISLAGFVMAIITQALKYPLASSVDMQRVWGIFTQGFVAGIVGLGIYLGITYLLDIKEFYEFKASAKKKWMKWTDIENQIDEPDQV